MPLDTQVSEPIEIHGQVGADLSVASTTYRGGTRVYGTINGPHMGPLQTGLTLNIPTNGSNTLYPAIQGDLSLGKDLTPWLRVKAAVNLGVQEYLTGLNNPDLSQIETHPFGKASISTPVSDTLSDGTKIGVIPSISGLWYPGIQDITLKIDDKNLDGTPDYSRPATELVTGLEVFLEKDGWGVNTRWNYDILDPTTPEKTLSLFATVGAYRRF